MTEKEPKKKRSSKLSTFVTYNEYSNFIIPHIKSIHHKIGAMLAFESNLRIAEVIGLKKEHIDMERKRIYVKGGKGNKDRVTILPKHWREEYMKYIPIACSKRALQTAFMGGCERSGLYKIKSDVHFHSLRHGFATFLNDNGVDIKHIQMLMGHADISTTMIYIRMSPEKSLEAGRSIW